MDRNLRGFTVIELLMVVAIISLLVAVALTSTGIARDKANDAGIKQQISNMRPAAELYYSTNGSYREICNPAHITGKMFIAAVRFAGPGASAAYCLSDISEYYYLDSNGNIVVGPKAAMPSRWAASVELRQGGYFCADYRGTAKVTSTMTISPTDVDC
ncbi:MAG: type II secretion system protein [Patescibacteria group bacterium]